LLVVCCGLGLAACSHSLSHPADSTSAPAVTPTTTAAPSSAPATASATAAPSATTPLLTGAAVSPGETPPTMNAYAKQHNADGALAFAAYFYRAVDWSIATTNPDLLRPISAPSCQPCQQYIHGLDSLATAGGHSEGGRLRATSFSIANGDLVKADFDVKVTIDQQVNVIISPGKPAASYSRSPNPGINYLYIRWSDGWQALDIGGASP
jgi:hypothetical protein